jgi:hypothetical protein
MSKTFTDAQVIAASMVIIENDGGNQPLVEYLKSLLSKMWQEGEGFNGKRPFGNSGWQFHVYAAFVKAGLIEGKLDPQYGWVDKCDDEAGDALVQAVIQRLLVLTHTEIEILTQR